MAKGAFTQDVTQSEATETWCHWQFMKGCNRCWWMIGLFWICDVTELSRKLPTFALRCVASCLNQTHLKPFGVSMTLEFLGHIWLIKCLAVTSTTLESTPNLSQEVVIQPQISHISRFLPMLLKESSNCHPFACNQSDLEKIFFLLSSPKIFQPY